MPSVDTEERVHNITLYLAFANLILFPLMLLLGRPQRTGAFGFLGMALVLLGVHAGESRPGLSLITTLFGVAVMLLVSILLVRQKRRTIVK